MALTLKQAQAPKCPAAEIQQPVLSPRPVDFECRISGQLFPPGHRPCDGCYSECKTWRTHKKQLWANTSQFLRDELRNNRANHTLSG